ncbi:unnamed protein product [Arctogadus glacialis]
MIGAPRSMSKRPCPVSASGTLVGARRGCGQQSAQTGPRWAQHSSHPIHQDVLEFREGPGLSDVAYLIRSFRTELSVGYLGTALLIHWTQQPSWDDDPLSEQETSLNPPSPSPPMVSQRLSPLQPGGASGADPVGTELALDFHCAPCPAANGATRSY